MQTSTIRLSEASNSDVARVLSAGSVDALAASLASVGLIQPITVRTVSMYRDGRTTTGYKIVAGHHRVAAARQLGWTEIEAFVLPDGASVLDAELIEIDENLCRSELTAAQRSSAIRRRKEIWGALHPEESGRIPPTLGGRGNTSFASETAEVSGESKRRINEHLARADALGDDLDEVVGTSLDKGVELDALARMDAPERRELIDRAKAGEQVTARAQSDDDANVRRVRQMLAELERCAKYMDEREFAVIASRLDVSGSARRLAASIANPAALQVV